MPLVEQELFTLQGNMSSTQVISGVCITRSLVLSLFVLLYFFFWPLCCLFFFDILILITHLVSLNSSYWTWCWKIRYILSNAYRLYILWALSNTNKTNQVRWFHLRICCQQINKKQLLYAIVYLQINRWILYLYINVIKVLILLDHNILGYTLLWV